MDRITIVGNLSPIVTMCSWQLGEDSVWQQLPNQIGGGEIFIFLSLWQNCDGKLFNSIEGMENSPDLFHCNDQSIYIEKVLWGCECCIFFVKVVFCILMAMSAAGTVHRVSTILPKLQQSCVFGLEPYKSALSKFQSPLPFIGGSF